MTVMGLKNVEHIYHTSQSSLYSHIQKYAPGQLAVLMFTLQGCSPCKAIKAEIEANMHKKFQDRACFFYIDISENEKLLSFPEFNIHSAPTFKFAKIVDNGGVSDLKISAKEVKGNDKVKLESVINSLL
jgi:thiol-disulfide isomerase/thioredoxin